MEFADIHKVCPYSDERHLRIGRRSRLLRKKSRGKSKKKKILRKIFVANIDADSLTSIFERFFSLDFWGIFCEAILIHLIHGENWSKVVIASQEPTVTVREARESKSK